MKDVKEEMESKGTAECHKTGYCVATLRMHTLFLSSIMSRHDAALRILQVMLHHNQRRRNILNSTRTLEKEVLRCSTYEWPPIRHMFVKATWLVQDQLYDLMETTHNTHCHFIRHGE